MRVISCLFFLILFFSPSFCCAIVAPDIQNILSRGKLIVAFTDKDYHPFFYHNVQKNYEGLDIDLAYMIADALGVKLEINASAASFNDVITKVENGEADIGMGALSATLSRGLHVYFTTPYLKQHKVLIVNRVLDLKLESAGSTGFAAKLKFGVVKNSAYESFLKKNFYTISKYTRPERVVTFATQEEAMQNLISGKIYAIFTDEISAGYFLKHYKSANIYSKKYTIERQLDPISMAVSVNHPTLLNWLNLFVEDFKDSGSSATIFDKYLKGLK